MAINIFEVLLAKSEDAESLKSHILSGLQRIVELHNAIDEAVVTWPTWREKDKRYNFFVALSKAIILHDFGKIDYGFQKSLASRVKIQKAKDEVLEALNLIFSGVPNPHFNDHEILSALMASVLLENNREKWHDKIISAILFHHFNRYFYEIADFVEIIFDQLEKFIEYLEFVINKRSLFENSFNSILGEFKKRFDAQPFIRDAIDELQALNWNNINKAHTQLTRVYEEDDLSAFAEYYKPPSQLNIGINHSDTDEEVLDFLVFLGALHRIDYAASGKVNLEKTLSNVMKFDEIADQIESSIVSNLKSNEDFVFWQKHLLSDKGKMNKLILVAPTGSGKTEFSILWSAKNPRKYIYTLPLRVALNDLYKRFKGDKEFDSKGYFNEDVVNLLHSTAFIEYVEGDINVEKKVTAARLLADPILLSTPDQIFLTSLNYYGSDKVIATYPYSNIVIDEIQVFNPEMAAVIINTLSIIQALGGNILVMTATYPPYFEEFFKKMGFDTVDVENEGVKVKNLTKKRHRIEVRDELLFTYENRQPQLTDEALNILNELKGKENALIVVNNVRKAIELYDKLKNLKKNLSEFNDFQIFLLHSRIVEKYKSKRIDNVKKHLRNKEKVILVATQVVEASVDADFDFMVTEISPIDSQIQRWGRVFRSRDDEYTAKSPNIVIFAGKTDGNERAFDRGTTAIYRKDVLAATVQVLKKFEGKALSYIDEKEMVKQTFEIGGEKSLKEKYIEEIEKNLEFLKYFSAAKKSEAQRIFRNIAGITVTVPALMKVEGEEWQKELAKLIENGGADRLSWDEIFEKIGLQPQDESEKSKFMWKSKAALYEYSLNIPAFSNERYYSRLNGEFKGFLILKVDDKEINDLKVYGLDKLKEFREDEEFDSIM